MDVYKETKKIILKRMVRQEYIGGRHTAIENLNKGLPKDKVGFAKEIVAELIKDNLVIVKPAGYGYQVSLNKNKLKEIEEIIYS